MISHLHASLSVLDLSRFYQVRAQSRMAIVPILTFLTHSSEEGGPKPQKKLTLGISIP